MAPKNAPRFVGGWVTEKQYEKMNALAIAKGSSVQGVIREFADSFTVSWSVPAPKESSDAIHPDAVAASR